MTENTNYSCLKIPSDFLSQKTCCRGDLYLPKGRASPPIVVMAHGFGAERTFGLPAFAETFAQNGLAVYLFDYRCFGDSDGKPRNFVDPKRHLADWAAAVDNVRSLPDIDSRKVALWGSSFSGGHVIVRAANDPSIAAIVIQVPFVDAISTTFKLGFKFLAQAVPHGIRDLSRIMTFRPPHFVKIIGTPDEFAVMNTPESFPGYTSMIPEDTDWENKCPARILLKFAAYRPISAAPKVQCPALVMLAENDSLIDPEAVEKTAHKMPNAELVKYPFGHFDIYTGDAFNDAVARQCRFLLTHLEPE